jgi:hypothetical protein
MLSTRLLIIILTFLLAASSIAAAADTPSFPDMTCKGSGSGTCTPGNAPFFNIGPIDETKYDPDSASKRTSVNEPFIAINKLPTRVKARHS